MSTSTHQEKEVSNANIKVKVQYLPECKVKLEIIIAPIASKAAYNKAIKEVSKEISIPGFRRGKAPQTTLIQKYSPQIKSEWEKILLNTAVTEAFGLANLFPAMDSNNNARELKVLSQKLSRDEDSSMKIEFETAPEIPHVDLAQLNLLETDAISITDEQSEEKLHDLRINKAEWEVLEDKKIEEGDFVDVSFTNPEDEPSKSEDIKDSHMTRYWVCKGKVPDDYYKELIGLKVNDTFIFQEEGGEAARSTIRAVLKPKLPEANDEFAQQYGAPDLATLKSRIAQSLEIEAKNAQVETINNDLIKQLLEKFPMELPATTVSKHRQTIVNRTLSNLKKMMPDSSKEDRQAAISNLDAVLDTRSRDVTHLRFIVHSYAHQNKIAVTDKEFEKEMTDVYYRSQAGIGPYIDFSDDISEIQSEVYNQLTTQKVLAALVEKIRKRS